MWGLGRVVGHQEFASCWGGLIDIDDSDDLAETASHICEHILAQDAEDQIAIRDHTMFVPRLRPSSSLTQSFPTKLTPDATYVVTGGAGALGRIVATYLAERGARHIALLSRSEIPPRDQWSLLPEDHRHHETVNAIRKIEHLGAQVTTASVDITDADQVKSWLSSHIRSGGRPVRGIIHAAGSVDDRLLVNMTENDFTKVMAPKIKGARVLHNAFRGQRSGILRDVRVGGIGDRLARAGKLRGRERVPRCVRALSAGSGPAGAHNRLGAMVGGDGRRSQAGEDLRAAGNRAHHTYGGHTHP